MKPIQILFLILSFFFTHQRVDNQGLMCLLSKIYPVEVQVKVFNKIDHLISNLENDSTMSSEIHFTNEIQHQIHTVLINFESLFPTLQESILSCNLNTKNTLKRCEAKYGENNCEEVNQVTFSRVCPIGFKRFNQFFCFAECPKGFIEQKDRCEKPEAFIVETYDDLMECKRKTKGFCDKDLTTSLFLPRCPDSFERHLKFICIPKCLPEFVETVTHCHKTERLESGEMFVLSLEDFLSE